jgi:hypothetical protein
VGVGQVTRAHRRDDNAPAVRAPRQHPRHVVMLWTTENRIRT